MDKREFKIRNKAKKLIDEVEKRSLDDIKEEASNIRDKIRRHEKAIVKLETRLSKLTTVVKTIEPPKTMEVPSGIR